MAEPLQIALGILGDALDLLTDTAEDPPCAPLVPEVCRTAIYLGGEVPWDSCGGTGCGDKNGMLWAKLISVDPTQGGSDQGNCPNYTWTAEFGIVRCITGMGNNGEPPPAGSVTADALQQAKDADAIFTILRCCPARTEALKDVTLSRWNPLGPLGDCAGGAWTVRGVFGVCC